jgi:L-alanine-DL-glutamate epimerase-like enolase superfamily enzyme
LPGGRDAPPRSRRGERLQPEDHQAGRHAPVYDAGVLCEKLGMKVNLASKFAETGISTAAVSISQPRCPPWTGAWPSPASISTDDILETPHVFESGHINVPAGPGLGIEVDEVKVRRYAREA